MSFSSRHRKYVNFLRKKTTEISRSKMWSDLSPDFLTEMEAEKPVMNTFRQKKYFVIFGKDDGITFSDTMRYKAVKFLESLVLRFKRRVMNKDLQWRIIFNELGYYSLKTKYHLYGHPLFGKDKCVHGVVLYLQWHNYCMLYPYIKDIKNMRYFEIGAGSGLLSIFFHHDLGAKVVIVDLPEMISYSSACVHQMFPEAKILLPHEVKNGLNYDDYDFVFLLPDQTNYLPGDYFDLAVNCQSMGEMRKEEIDTYFKVIQDAVKNGGYFFCSNRLRKEPGQTPTTDTITPLTSEVLGTNHFFRYPWNDKNIDVLIDVHHYRLNWLKESPLTIERLQKIVK